MFRPKRLRLWAHLLIFPSFSNRVQWRWTCWARGLVRHCRSTRVRRPWSRRQESTRGNRKKWKRTQVKWVVVSKWHWSGHANSVPFCAIEMGERRLPSGAFRWQGETSKPVVCHRPHQSGPTKGLCATSSVLRRWWWTIGTPESLHKPCEFSVFAPTPCASD